MFLKRKQGRTSSNKRFQKFVVLIYVFYYLSYQNFPGNLFEHHMQVSFMVTATVINICKNQFLE